jgi:RNA polymerase sigma-70 factor, ECF subfamily
MRGMTMATMTVTTREVWQQFREELSAFIRRRVAQPADADDVLQKTFLSLHRHLRQSPPPNNLRAWLHQVARNAITDSIRDRRGIDQSLESLPNDPAHDGDDAETKTLTDRLTRCLANLVQALPNNYRDALTWTDLEGQSQSAAATRAGVSVSGMKSRVQRARSQLREALLHCCAVELDRQNQPLDMTCHQPDRCDCA